VGQALGPRGSLGPAFYSKIEAFRGKEAAWKAAAGHGPAPTSCAEFSLVGKLSDIERLFPRLRKLAQARQRREYRRLSFDLGERAQLILNILPVKLALADGHALRIPHVERPRCE